jgi:hypothetical protein
MGDFPLWNPLVGMGAPLAANYQSALFYPVNWLSWMLYELGGLGWAAWSLGVIITIHLSLAGLGMGLFARSLGIGRLGQSVSGLAFGLSGYLLARGGFLSLNASVAWLPWILLGVELLVSQYNRKRVLYYLAVIFCLQLLAGHAQTCWYTLQLAVSWLGYRLLQSRRKPAVLHSLTVPKSVSVGLMAPLSSLAWFGLAYGTACVLAAIQLIPTGEYLLQSQRAQNIFFEFAMVYSFWPWRFLTLLAPNLFGSPVMGDFHGYGNYWEDAIYIGLIPVTLALTTLAAQCGRLLTRSLGRKVTATTRTDPEDSPDNQGNDLVWFLAAVVGLSFILALGSNTPIYPWLYHHVPTFDIFQAPTRYSILAVFGLALLAGYGAQAWRRPSGRGLYWSRLAIAGALAVCLGSGLAWLFIGVVGPTFIRAMAILGFLALSAVILNLTAPETVSQKTQTGGSKYRFWSCAVIGVIAIDLILAGWGLHPWTDQRVFTQADAGIDTFRSAVKGGRVYIPDEIEYDLKFHQFMRFDTFQPKLDWMEMRRLSLPNLNMLEGIYSANNFDPFTPRTYSTWMERLEESSSSIQAKMLDLMSVGAVLEAGNSSGIPRWIIRESVGRYRFVPCAKWVNDEQDVWKLVTSDTFNPYDCVIVEGLQSEQDDNCSEVPAPAEIILNSERPGRARVIINNQAAGWLVRSETWFPGWRVKIDGVDHKLMRANGNFQAVWMPAGKHSVEFLYWPVSFQVGLFLSSVGVAFLSLLWRMWK